MVDAEPARDAAGDPVRDEIRAFLARFSSDPEWLDSSSLLDGRVLDSLMAVQLILFLEGTFDLTVEDEDLEPENFNSIAGMVRLVHRKRGR